MFFTCCAHTRTDLQGVFSDPPSLTRVPPSLIKLPRWLQLLNYGESLTAAQPTSLEETLHWCRDTQGLVPVPSVDPIITPGPTEEEQEEEGGGGRSLTSFTLFPQLRSEAELLQRRTARALLQPRSPERKTTEDGWMQLQLLHTAAQRWPRLRIFVPPPHVFCTVKITACRCYLTFSHLQMIVLQLSPFISQTRRPVMSSHPEEKIEQIPFAQTPQLRRIQTSSC